MTCNENLLGKLPNHMDDSSQVLLKALINLCRIFVNLFKTNLFILFEMSLFSDYLDGRNINSNNINVVY